MNIKKELESLAGVLENYSNAPRPDLAKIGAQLRELGKSTTDSANAAKAWVEGWKASQNSPYTSPGGRQEDTNPYE